MDQIKYLRDEEIGIVVWVTDGLTDRQTFAILELLLRLKNASHIQLTQKKMEEPERRSSPSQRYSFFNCFALSHSEFTAVRAK